jgi:hypothetical protein
LHRKILPNLALVLPAGTRGIPGKEQQVADPYGVDIVGDWRRHWGQCDIQFLKSRFVEDALCAALIRGKPLLARVARNSAFVLAGPHTEDVGGLDALFKIVGKASGVVTGLFAPPAEGQTEPEQVTWTEAVRVSIDVKNGQAWLLVDPDIWIWPPRARELAIEFMDERRKDRYNRKYNALLNAWTKLLLGSTERASDIKVSAFDAGSESENPAFHILTRTGFAWRLVS